MSEQYREVALALPAAYESEWLGDVACLRRIAQQRGEEGAAEGTLLIADNLDRATARAEKKWQGYCGNLHAAILLQPDVPESRYHELLIVGLVSLGQAISAHVSPMTALTYSWPNDINIARNKIASMWIDYGRSTEQRVPWLSLTVSVNIAHGPSDFSIPAMSLHEAEGNSEIDRDTVLTSWARQFVSFLNQWDERGFTHSLNFWKTRLDLTDRSVITKDGERRLVEVDEQGDAVVETATPGIDARLRLLQWMTSSET